ncbi:MAG: hypothetical protein L0Y68_03270 [Candidatus Dadabacteria bacterium]|nr:hypothetical protein [Candidatus Dadabacteria bacterium]
MEGQGQDPGQISGTMNSVLMAFNLGVSAHQQAGGNKSVGEIASELGETIYTNISRIYGNQFPEEYLRANTEFFLRIALLGYIIPGVCAYDEGLKNRLFALIEAKINQPQKTQSNPQGGSIITT